jgi:hypothetical protein
MKQSHSFKWGDRVLISNNKKIGGHAYHNCWGFVQGFGPLDNDIRVRIPTKAKTIQSIDGLVPFDVSELKKISPEDI